MKILSIDTSSNICGVSILEDTNLIIKLDAETCKTHSENLMPMIKQIFEQTKLSLKDIDLLVCDKGPGSFTGIRIGIATVKAFHDSLNIPCVGVTALETLAYSIKKDGLIISIIDCKNDNCYFALYELKNSNYIELISPSANTVKNTLSICKDYISLHYKNAPITFVGDGVQIYQNSICSKFNNATLADTSCSILNSYNLALAGLDKFKKNQLEDVLPLYLKKPQAQRQLEEKLNEIEIAQMTLEDLNSISSNLLTDFDEFWNYDILKGELLSENSKYIVAKYNSQIIGFAGIKLLIDKADIMNIVVKKQFRNQGIGKLLLTNLISLCKKLKLTSLSLEVMEENYPAIHLYKSLGFEQIGLRKNYYQDKNGYIMQKKL